MPNNRKVMDSIKTFLERMKACDENIPEELADDALEMVEGVKDALSEEEVEVVEEEAKDCDMKDEDLEKKIEDSLVKVLRKNGLIKDSSMKSLDECMGTEVKDEDEVDLIEETNDEDIDEEKKADDTANAIRKQLASIKPIIAAIPNARDRKRASDAIANLIKLGKGNQYADIMKTAKKAADEAKQNHTVNNADSDFDLGKKWAEKFNPHYMKEGK